MLGDALEDVDGLLGTIGLYQICQLAVLNTRSIRNTYTELYRGREELNTSGLGDLITTGNAGQVDESRLNNALLALGGLDDGLGKSGKSQSRFKIRAQPKKHT